MHSSMHKVRARPKTIPSNLGIQQSNGAGYSGQIIARPENDGLEASTQKKRVRHHNDVVADSRGKSDGLRQKKHGSSTVSKSQQISQTLSVVDSHNKPGFASRLVCIMMFACLSWYFTGKVII